jgi:hypothetical protein
LLYNDFCIRKADKKKVGKLQCTSLLETIREKTKKSKKFTLHIFNWCRQKITLKVIIISICSLNLKEEKNVKFNDLFRELESAGLSFVEAMSCEELSRFGAFSLEIS